MARPNQVATKLDSRARERARLAVTGERDRAETDRERERERERDKKRDGTFCSGGGELSGARHQPLDGEVCSRWGYSFAVTRFGRSYTSDAFSARIWGGSPAGQSPNYHELTAHVVA